MSASTLVAFAFFVLLSGFDAFVGVENTSSTTATGLVVAVVAGVDDGLTSKLNTSSTVDVLVMAGGDTRFALVDVVVAVAVVDVVGSMSENNDVDAVVAAKGDGLTTLDDDDDDDAAVVRALRDGGRRPRDVGRDLVSVVRRSLPAAGSPVAADGFDELTLDLANALGFDGATLSSSENESSSSSLVFGVTERFGGPAITTRC
jgi:hypothetical protein